MLAAPVQERCEHTGASSGKDHEGGRIGASVTGGEAEGDGTVLPGEGSVQGDLIHMYSWGGIEKVGRLFSVKKAMGTNWNRRKFHLM